MGENILGYDFETIDHIVRFADANDVPPVMLLASGLQESDLSLTAHGDVTIGDSYGVFQIYLPAHGHDAAYWSGIDGLDHAMAEMIGRWHQQFLNHGGWDGWVNDAGDMMQTLASDMQGSVEWDQEMAHERVSKAYAIYVLYLRQQTGETPEPAPNRERELIDALSIYGQAWRTQAAEGTVRADDIDRLIATF